MPRNYVYTDLSTKNSLTLEINGTTYEVVQFSSSWAANEIPTASVMLAIGRNVRAPRTKAAVHGIGGSLKQMQKAIVWFQPNGDYDRDSTWPEGRFKIFDGYFTGFAYRKINGKVTAIANLIHWLAALGFSSCLTKNGHVSNPTALNAAAVLDNLSADTEAGEGCYISSLVATQISATDVEIDVWKAIKHIFCTFASVDSMPCGDPASCVDSFTKNDTALEALSRIEGPVDSCNKAYKFGVPLKIETEGVPTLGDAMSDALGMEFVDSYASTSFWDKLVTQFCPMFNMAVVPMIDSAIVVADCPAFNGGFWREIEADDYDSYDMTRELHRPLKAVGVVASWDSQTKGGNGEAGNNFVNIGACYLADDADVSTDDGMVLYVASPYWLRALSRQPGYAGYNTGIYREVASKTSTTPLAAVAGAAAGALPPTPDTIVDNNVGKLYGRYAKAVFINQMLRGQAGAFSGKLRFDIAPLAILKINPTSDKFIGAGQDDLAFALYGCVQRVTVSINAEAGMAGTSFMIDHVRSEAENTAPRTSVTEHPLFGKSIHGGGKHGSPLADLVYPKIGLLAGDGPVAPPPSA